MTDTRSLPVAIGYFMAEVAFDGFTLWLIYTSGHHGWALAWSIYCGISANTNTKRFLGLSREESA